MKFQFLRALLLGCIFAFTLPLTAQKMEGMASFYADKFDGLKTSTGETFRQNSYMAASKDLPWGTIVEVTNISNGRKTQVRINDCGPHAKNRIIDLSRRAAQELDFIKQGEAEVRLRIIRTSNAGPNCGRSAWSKKLKAAGKPIPPNPGPWKPGDTAGETNSASAAVDVPVVTPAPATSIRGFASYYTDRFNGRNTSTGEVYNPDAYTAASKAYPYNTIIEVTNVATAQQVLVRVNDCGPGDGSRLLDLSKAAAAQVGVLRAGVASVDVRIVKLGTDGPTCNRAAWVRNIKENKEAAAEAAVLSPPAQNPGTARQNPTTVTPKSVVVVPPPVPGEDLLDAYRLQVGAFANPQSAYDLQDKLKAAGYSDAYAALNEVTGLFTAGLRTAYDKASAEVVKTRLIGDGFPTATAKQGVAPADLIRTAPASRAIVPKPASPEAYGGDQVVPPVPSGQAMVPAWTLQLGAFGKEVSAHELYTQLADKGYSDSYVYQNLDTKLYTVALQTAYNKGTAEQVKKQLKADGFPQANLKERQVFPNSVQSVPMSKGKEVAADGPKTYGSTVTAPQPSSEPAPAPAKQTFEPDVILFGVQVAAYSSEAAAQAMVEKLEAENLPEVYAAKVGKLTRVFAGKYYFQSQANVLKEALRAKGYDGATVRRVQ